MRTCACTLIKRGAYLLVTVVYISNGLTFRIRRNCGWHTRFPVAHTCGFDVDLPEYVSKEELEDEGRKKEK